MIGGAVSFEAFTRSAYTGYTMLRFRRKLATNTANYQRVHFVQLINLIPLVHDHATLAIPPAFCLSQKYEHKEIMSVLMLNPIYSEVDQAIPSVKKKLMKCTEIQMSCFCLQLCLFVCLFL